MSEEIEKHVLRKYEICQKLGKGVSDPTLLRLCHQPASAHLTA